MRAGAAFVITLTLVSLLSSCSGAPSTPVIGIYPRQGGYDQVLYQGTLIEHNGCLMLSPGRGDGALPPTMLVWTEGHQLQEEAGTTLIVDEDGRERARVGARVSLGGGPGSYGEATTQTGEPIPERCRTEQLAAISPAADD